MKSKTLLIMIGGALVLPSTFAFARVGEAEAQVDHRYGKVAGKWDDYLGYRKLYHWHGFEVMVTFTDGVSQREMFNRPGALLVKDQKYLRKFEGVGRNGIIASEESGVFTTKAFDDKFVAARTAAWEKAKQKPE